MYGLFKKFDGEQMVGITYKFIKRRDGSKNIIPFESRERSDSGSFVPQYLIEEMNAELRRIAVHASNETGFAWDQIANAFDSWDKLRDGTATVDGKELKVHTEGICKLVMSFYGKLQDLARNGYLTSAQVDKYASLVRDS